MAEIYPPTVATEPIDVPIGWIEYVEIPNADRGAKFVLDTTILPLTPGYNKIVFAEYLQRLRDDNNRRKADDYVPSDLHDETMPGFDSMALTCAVLNHIDLEDDSVATHPKWNAIYYNGKMKLYVTSVNGHVEVNIGKLDTDEPEPPEQLDKLDERMLAAWFANQ